MEIEKFNKTENIESKIEEDKNEKVLFVNRNDGAKDWAQDHGFEDADVVENFSTDMIEEGDTVIGTLPLHLAADICKKGGNYSALVMDPVPQELRGTSLSSEQMDELNATTQSMRVEVLEKNDPTENNIVVTRHAGAKEWLSSRGFDNVEIQDHFNPEDVDKVDESTTVVGVLPPIIVAEINKKDGKFISLDVNVPKEMFKEEISAEKMEELGAKLTGYKVTLK